MTRPGLVPDPLRRRLIASLKITHFLLDPTHTKGRHRERFFTRFGFRRSDPRVLADALLAHAVTGQITGTTTDTRGCLYAVAGPLRTPDGRDPRVVTVWIVRHIGPAELVTAYPE